MKRFIALLLVALMCVSALSLVACGGNSGTTAPEANTPSTGGSEKPTETPSKPTVETDDDGNTPNDIFTSVNYSPIKVEEHQVKDDLPDNFSLKGTNFLPPVSAQGDIASGASEAVTYLQFTNAVAQYVAKLDPATTWKPAINAKSCFSSKFTHQFVGNTIVGAYYFLRDHGSITKEVDDFARDTKGNSILFRNGTTLQTNTTRWVLTKGLGEEALAYRISNFEQVIITDQSGKYYNKDKNDDGVTYGVQLTTSDNGKDLLKKIKDAVVCGNVVVTTGYPDTWKTATLTADSGTAKKGETVITHASYETALGETKGKGTAHQIAIIGYDDTIECAVPGTTEGEVLKGAFLIQNSMGTGWHNKGYTWLFYDAVNTLCEFASFKISDTETRLVALDQFYFMYWDRDITTKLPGMFAELEIETTDRDALSVELGRTDAYGRYVGATPYMFVYTHPTYTDKATSAPDATDFYLSTNGKVNEKNATTAYYTVSFERLLASLMDGTTAENYKWSIKVTSKGSEDTDAVKLKSAVIKNGEGQVITTVKFDGEAEKVQKSTNTYVFQLSDAPVTKAILAGDYSFKNVGAGKYLAADGSMKFKVDGTAKNALNLKVQYQSEEKSYLLWRIEKGVNKEPTMAIDVNPKEVVTTGATLQFNAQSKERATTQNWKLSHNSDGTVTFYITTEKGTNYALAVVNDVVCIKKATELTDDMKWTFTPTATTQVTSSVSVSGKTLVVEASVASKVTAAKIVVVDTVTGEVVTTQDATVENKAVTATVTLPETTAAGLYLVKVLNAEDSTAAASFTFVAIA